MRIFLSYGHDGYSSLADRIKRDLEVQGNEVWFDQARLQAGRDWERYVEDGIDWVSAIPGAGRFLLLMTPHSVRRPDGYCLNELARAHARNLPTVPVMVATVEPPLSISRLQWIDLRRCFPAQEHEVQYTEQFEQLSKSLRSEQVAFEGVQQRLLNYLQPVAYDDDLTRHLSRFTGREWAMTEVDRWLASSRRMLWVTGEAGVGKSAFAAWLCDRRPEIAACHFCRFGNSDRSDPLRVLASLAYQLSTQLPAYQDALNASALDLTVVETNPAAAFERLFVKPLADVPPISGTPRVILIDALDEATLDGKNDLATLLGSELHRLPPWLRIIVTSRPHEAEINFPLQALDPWKLDAGRHENIEDIRTYLRRELRRLSEDQEPRDEILNQIVERSEGLFLYVSWVRQELEDNRFFLENIADFPRGLGGVYAGFFKRHFPDSREYAARCRPALEAICAAGELLECHDLASIFSWSDYEMRSLLERLGSLFPVTDGRVRPFHRSLLDWLADSQRSGPYYVDAKTGEIRLANYIFQQCQLEVGRMSRYCVLQAPAYLVRYGKGRDLARLLLEFDWIRAKLRAAGVQGLLADYDIAEQSVYGSEVDSDAFAVRMVQGALRLSAHVLVGDTSQLAGQLCGRLSPEMGPDIQSFLNKVRDSESTGIWPVRATLTQPGGSLLRTLTGHTNQVTEVAITPDGKSAVSASMDGTLKVWDLASGRELRTLVGHTEGIHALAVTPDGKLAVTAAFDKTMRVWDLASGQQLRTMSNGLYGVSAMALTSDGAEVVSVSDRTWEVWEVASGRKLRVLAGDTAAARAVAVMPGGKLAISALCDGSLSVRDLANGRKLKTLKGHGEWVMAVAVTPDGKMVISASMDHTLKVWDLADGRELRTLCGHPNSVDAVAVTPDGQLVVSASADNTLKVWDLRSGRELRTLSGHLSIVCAVAVTPDSKLLVSGSSDQSLKLWRIDGVSQEQKVLGHSSYINALAISSDGTLAVSGSADRTLKVWNLVSGRALHTLKGHKESVSAVAMSSDGRLAVSGSGDHTLKVWALDSGRKLSTLTGHTGWVSAVAITPNGKLAVSGSGDQTVKVWDLARGRELRTLKGHTDHVTSVAVTADGRLVVSAARNQTLKVWDLASGRELCSLDGHSSWVMAMAATMNGELAVTGSIDKTLKVWDLASRRELRTFAGHTDHVNAVAVTPDGRLAFSVSDDRTLKVWAPRSGVTLATFTTDDVPHRCAVSADGTTVVVGSGAGTLHHLRFGQPRLVRSYSS